ncbi:unnamed protein product, partial [Amoebophrya sp. A120]|eukprot:GSA120T00025150001.1
MPDPSCCLNTMPPPGRMCDSPTTEEHSCRNEGETMAVLGEVQVLELSTSAVEHGEGQHSAQHADTPPEDGLHLAALHSATTWVDTEDQLERAIGFLRCEKIVDSVFCVDCEWRPGDYLL